MLEYLSGRVIQICLFLYDSSLLKYDVTLIGTQLLWYKGACCLHVQSLRSPRKETQIPGRVLCVVLKNDPELILRKPHGLSLGGRKELNKRGVSVYGLALQRAYIRASRTS